MYMYAVMNMQIQPKPNNAEARIGDQILMLDCAMKG